MEIKYIQILNSPKIDKRYVARFYDESRNMVKQTHFGSKTGLNYTLHKDKEVKENWIARHRALNEDWNNYTSAGALSKHLLWNRTSLAASFRDYLKRFKLKEY
tara:strand:+ start:123 stop:431 length:309 start_codon:yes stop_codon:yes gene_type:complete